MKALLLLVAVVLSLMCSAQESYDTYGKTESQILAMTQQQWYDFYVAHAGESTASSSNAYWIYGEVEKKRNDRMVASYPQKKKLVARLRSLLQNYGAEAISIGSAQTGGGTMWNPISSQMGSDLEQTIFGVLGGGTDRNQKLVVSTVQKKLNAVKVKIDAMRGESGFDYKMATSAFLDMKADFRKILSEAKSLDRHGSDSLLGFCLNWSTIAETAGG